jgi:hypothetical protein
MRDTQIKVFKGGTMNLDLEVNEWLKTVDVISINTLQSSLGGLILIVHYKE